MIQARWTSPVEDSDSDLKEESITYEDGVYNLFFKLARSETFQDDCFHFMYPVGGGTIGSGGTISKHDNTPIITPKQICVKQCGAAGKAEKSKTFSISPFCKVFLVISA